MTAVYPSGWLRVVDAEIDARVRALLAVREMPTNVDCVQQGGHGVKPCKSVLTSPASLNPHGPVLRRACAYAG